MFRAASAYSTNPAGAEAAADCIAQLERAGVTDPDFILVHANCAIGLDLFGRALHARWPASRLHAATSCLGGMTDVAIAMAPEAGIGLLAISDPTGGFKCFRRSALASIGLETIQSNGYSFQIELTHRIWRRGGRIAETPIIFTDRFQGSSKMSGGIVREALWMVWKLWFENALQRHPRPRGDSTPDSSSLSQ
jgi:hypothetical protein